MVTFIYTAKDATILTQFEQFDIPQEDYKCRVKIIVAVNWTTEWHNLNNKLCEMKTNTTP